MAMHALSRRRFAAVAAGLGALLAVAACGGTEELATGTAAASASAGGPWVWTDDRGRRIELPQRPTRIVAQSSAAAALWDFGVRPVGVFGPHKLKDGSPDPEVGEVDISTVESLGNVWDEFNVERYAALRPDVLISGMYQKDTLWYVPEKSKEQIEQIAPTIGVQLTGRSLVENIATYEKLAAHLGADPDAAGVPAAKARFEAAVAELKRTVAEKRLKVTFITGDADNVYFANPGNFPDVKFFTEQGLDVVVPEKPGEDGFWEAVSWENADKYEVDVIFHDARAQSMTLAEMKAKPTFARLPAVQAGQVYPWRAEQRYSYLGHAISIEELTANLAKAKEL